MCLSSEMLLVGPEVVLRTEQRHGTEAGASVLDQTQELQAAVGRLILMSYGNQM